jgi:RHS repeat-associated protein
VGIFTESDNLYYMRARYYDAEVGRFISEDPAGFVDSTNLYAYVAGNPIMGVDPSGLFSFLVSRGLDSVLGAVANHNFVVVNADFIGDPNADIYSFGDIGNGTMGSVNNVSAGPAANTFANDVVAWRSLASGNPDVTYRLLNASDKTVELNARSVVSGVSAYNLIPGLQGGTNSNSAAGAVATRSDGGMPRVNNTTLQPGNRQHSRVQFRCQ